ncbi:MAG: helix-turn-helix transcriptional regulator, partial [Coprobacillus sp.]|nr:helix-turn-helix transcriptional regulator [Coprobacillus sp.]
YKNYNIVYGVSTFYIVVLRVLYFYPLFYLALTFKMIVKMSPYDYLIHYRLLKSIDYLLDSTFNITEISKKNDFQNVNHYI